MLIVFVIGAKIAGATVVSIVMVTDENQVDLSAIGEDNLTARIINVLETPRRPSPIDETSYIEIDRDGPWSGFFDFSSPPSLLLNYFLVSASLEVQAAHTTNVHPYVNGNYLSRVDSGEREYWDLLSYILVGSNQIRMDALPTGCPADVWICQGGLAFSAKLILGYEKRDTPPPPEEVPESRTVKLVVAGIFAIFVVKYLRWSGCKITFKK